MTIRVSNKGWVVIPSELRRRYKLNPGTEVQIVDYGGILAIVPIKENPIEESAGMLAGGGRSLTQALLDDHNQELEKANHRLSYADALAAATAQLWRGKLLTGDPELKALDGSEITVEWLPR
jgi:AbrB family looped-hinge helix DNA binding protein